MSISEQGRMMATGDGARDGELDLGAVGRALVRKKWWVLGPALAVAALTFVGVNLVTPKYKSEARILIEGRENVFFRPDAEKTAERDRTVDAEAITSQVQLALSRDVARQVIKALKLGELPEFDPALRGVSLLRYSLGFLGLAKDPLGMTAEERVLEAYFERLAVFPVDKSRVIAIEFQSSDPELAASVVNSVADNYIAIQQTARQDQTRAASKWLAGEIEVLRKRVAEAEAKVEALRAKTDQFVGTNNTTLSSQTLGEANRDLAVARSQKNELESKARFIRDLLKRGATLESADVINNDQIRQWNQQRATLKGQLAEQSATLLDNHPRIKELKANIADLDKMIRDQAGLLARSLENDAKIASARVEELSRGLDQLKQQTSSTNGQDIELRALEREAKAQRDLLESYLAKYREASARDSLGAVPGDARIISRAAVSNTPFFPKKLPIVLIATLATLFLGAGFITTGELLAGNVYRAEGVPVAEPIEPMLMQSEPAAPATPAGPKAKRRWLPAALSKAGPAAPPVEAIEPVEAAPAPPPAAERETASSDITIADIALAVQESGDMGKRIAVLGASANVGTSSTAVALARALARSARVVLIDLSLDRPNLAAITMDPTAPGIADLVGGSATFAQIITRDPSSRAQVVPAGRVGLDAASIYRSDRLAVAVDALSRTYDHVIIDAGAAPGVPADRIARLAPCAVMVAGGVAAASADAVRAHLAAAGFEDIAVFDGTAPAIDAGNAREVAA
jgi:succinoglycan biosynthesis transport protein ExoP